MRHSFFIFFSSMLLLGAAQDAYDKARNHFNDHALDSARFYINQALAKKPSANDYFLSGMIHEAQQMPLRALADYEAVIQQDPTNLEAYFQKGLIYYNSASAEQAIEDFTYVINNQSGSATRAIYYGRDRFGTKGTFLTTLQSMIAQVYQYRGLAYQKLGELTLAMEDFNRSFAYDTTADFYINRAQLHSKSGNESLAVVDLKHAIELDSNNYLAWYNLALLDESVLLPEELLVDQTFSPMLNLMGANAYESGKFKESARYHTQAITNDPADDLALIGRGKALLKLGVYEGARKDFISAMQLNAERTEAFFLIGNSLFYEKRFEEAIAFYDRYLAVDQFYASVWHNAAMSLLSIKQTEKACVYLQRAKALGMDEEEILAKHCGSQ